mmetsp:Transcript_3518/g.8309  ORF Transcript_3518/g.8309 Transcript_3518/m.8309 type:complete len:159 (-) Transcript_3518:181-657(-)|eukprot:CAMPEP_0114502374 /NCGR_PEP_ID=MMETSP0109-20121206/9053_1 /TAXON_ID=29199 /ORGANISM="Chlorarachnion reptans, Strain CCCM449" /LENGTH=158 /DNA_ID=CAMNT_0001680277 /DNA_START=285 /DNA_END=761 /DNA_ORIENTATION=+
MAEELAKAISKNDKDKVKELLESAPDCVNSADSKTKWVGLHHATKAGSLECVKLLLEAKAISSLCTHHNSTALHIAACNQKPNIALELIKSKCPLEARDNKKNTALLRACQHGSTKVLKVLLEARADATVENVNKQTALIRATEGNHQECLDLLEGTH